MNLIDFPEQNIVYSKDQPQYRPLPAYKYHDDPEGRIVCCWKLTWRERFRVLFGGLIWHSILTFNDYLQPQLLSTEKPDMPDYKYTEPHEPPKPSGDQPMGHEATLS
jgi:hypothetical protein